MNEQRINSGLCKNALIQISRLACVTSVVFTEPVFGDERDVQPLEFNTFVRNWQILGPFPSQPGSAGGLEHSYVDDEATLREGSVRFSENKLLRWFPYHRGVVDFGQAFRLRGQAGEFQVAYAYTEVISPVAQDVTMAFVQNDGVVAR